MTETRYANHFTGDLYSDDSPSDFGPFATDEGADIFAAWEGKADALSQGGRVRDILAEDVEDIDEFIELLTNGDPGMDAIVIGAAFTFMRLTDRLDEEGRKLALEAIGRSQEFYGRAATDFNQIATDIASF